MGVDGGTGDRRLIIAFDISARSPGSRWIEPFRKAWPRHLDAPVIEAMGLYDFRGLLRETKPHDRGEGARDALAAGVLDPVCDCALLVVGPGFPHTHLYQIADHLDRTITPAIVVLDDRAEDEIAAIARGVLDGHGILATGGGVDPGHLASAVAALMLRQPALERLAAELRIGQICQRQIHGELDRVHGELHLASQLQNDFVRCAVPYTPEVDFGVVYRPATYVSGDIFDVERLDEHHIGVFIADAVGHGVPAGMLTLFISRSLPKIDGFRGGARIVPPGEALARLNNAYCGRTGTNSRFATAMYGVIDTRSMTMRLAGAGHPSAVLARRGGAVERPASSGPLLGIFPDAAFDEATIDLADAAGLVMFTDGFEVAYPDGGEPGGDIRYETLRHEAALIDLARAAGTREGLADAIARVQQGLDHQIGSLHQADDVTAIVVAPRKAAGSSCRAA